MLVAILALASSNERHLEMWQDLRVAIRSGNTTASTLDLQQPKPASCGSESNSLPKVGREKELRRI